MNLDRSALATPTLELANWIANLEIDQLPARTREVVRFAILDTIGTGIYGYCTPWAQMVLAWVKRGNATGEARVWGEAQPTLRTADAALVNGTAAHACEFDDTHYARLHGGAAVIPAAIAVAERLNCSGSELITAIAAGYEVMIRSSLALNPQATRLRGWHITGVCGTFGAAAACASLLKLDPEQTAWALGLAGTQSAGLWAFNADGTMSKRLHPGKAAHSGVLAAELAQLGFSGPTQIYETTDGGVLRAFSDDSDPAPLTKDLGRVYHLDKNSVKPYSSCGATHAYIDAALDLRRKLGAPWDEHRRVRAGVSKMTAMQCGADYVPGSSLNAQMSVRYTIAAALVDGEVLPVQFADDKLSFPTLVGLASRIELIPDPELDKYYPRNFAGWVAVEHDGKWMRVDILNATGSEDKPIDAAGVTEKFCSLNPEYPGDKICASALGIEQYSIRDFMALVRPHAVGNRQTEKFASTVAGVT